jgi:hypothetical protein
MFDFEKVACIAARVLRQLYHECAEHPFHRNVAEYLQWSPPNQRSMARAREILWTIRDTTLGNVQLYML